MQYKRFLVKREVNAESMPVPRKFSSNCGIGIRFSTMEDISNLISEDIEKIFLLGDEEGRLIYSDDWQK
jgi:Protein of unknown function (DUF3343).